MSQDEKLVPLKAFPIEMPIPIVCKVVIPHTRGSRICGPQAIAPQTLSGLLTTYDISGPMEAFAYPMGIGTFTPTGHNRGYKVSLAQCFESA